MSELTIHEIPDDTFAAFAASATRRGQSVEEAVLELIRTAAIEETLMQRLERASQAAESVDVMVAKEGRSPRSRRRYRSHHPTPTALRR